jgi:hypothetical protein
MKPRDPSRSYFWRDLDPMALMLGDHGEQERGSAVVALEGLGR